MKDCLPEGRARQPREVDAARPGAVSIAGVEAIRIAPRAFNQAGRRIGRGDLLRDPGAVDRPCDAARARAAVPPGAEHVNRVARAGRVDEEVDRLAAVDARLRGVAFDLARQRRIGQLPVRRARFLVLDGGREGEGEQHGQHRRG